MRTVQHESLRCTHLDFQGSAGAHWTPREGVLYVVSYPPSPDEPIPGATVPLDKKRQLSPGLRPTSPSGVCVTAAAGGTNPPALSVSGFRNFRLIPFRGCRRSGRTSCALAHPLGPTDPRSIAVHAEPCSLGPRGFHPGNCYYHQDLHPRRVHGGARPPLPPRRGVLPTRGGIVSQAYPHGRV